MARQKSCPECSTETVIATKVCKECSYDFSAAKKEREEKKKQEIEQKRLEKEEKKEKETEEKLKIKLEKQKDKKKVIKIDPEVALLMEEISQRGTVETEYFSPNEHADRILSYGKERATSLLKQSNGKWSHVNWKKVEEELSKMK